MKKQVIVTTSWDDGHKLDLKLAKLLKKHGLKGTFYIAPKNREWNKKDLLSNSEIKQLSQDFEIGAHTMTHPNLTKISEEKAFREIKDSKIFLEKLINKEVKMFCYPKGLYNEKIKGLVKKAGFIGARTIKRFSISAPADFFELKTAIHTFPHRINFSRELLLKTNLSFISSLFTKDWLRIAQKIFDDANKNGGIYHLWGHSWLIDRYDDWEKVEKLVFYISKAPNLEHLENREIIKGAKHEEKN